MSKPKHTKQSSRSKARALAFQILYSLEFAEIRSLASLRRAYSTAPRVKVSYEKANADEFHIVQNEEDGKNTHFSPTLDTLPAQEDDTIEDVYTSIAPTGFSWEIVEGVWTNVDVLDDTIKEFIKNWRVDRLGKIERTILRMALFEMLYRDDIPEKVSIAEALEITNQFADAKVLSFINGLLNAVHKTKLGEQK